MLNPCRTATAQNQQPTAQNQPSVLRMITRMSDDGDDDTNVVVDKSESVDDISDNSEEVLEGKNEWKDVADDTSDKAEADDTSDNTGWDDECRDRTVGDKDDSDMSGTEY